MVSQPEYTTKPDGELLRWSSKEFVVDMSHGHDSFWGSLPKATGPPISSLGRSSHDVPQKQLEVLGSREREASSTPTHQAQMEGLALVL